MKHFIHYVIEGESRIVTFNTMEERDAWVLDFAMNVYGERWITFGGFGAIHFSEKGLEVGHHEAK